jgi:hypothetical protein
MKFKRSVYKFFLFPNLHYISNRNVALYRKQLQYKYRTLFTSTVTVPVLLYRLSCIVLTLCVTRVPVSA